MTRSTCFRGQTVSKMKFTARVFVLLPLCIILAFLYFFNPEEGAAGSPNGRANYNIGAMPRKILAKFANQLPEQSPPEQDGERETDFNIYVNDRHTHTFNLHGSLFNERGRSHDVPATMTTALLHSFSPDVERLAASKFLDPAKGNTFLANSPAITFYNNEIILVCRIWLQREKYEKDKTWPANHFPDNLFFTQKFDRHFRPLNKGEIMGIPSPKQWWIGDGPIEPRIFNYKNKLYVSFNAAMMFGYKRPMDFTALWDYFDHAPIIPHISGNNPMQIREDGGMPRDKHWAPYVSNDSLHFVHNIDPVHVLKCAINGSCDFAHYEGTRSANHVFHVRQIHLRGGTPFVEYKWPYYIGFAHSLLYKRRDYHKRYYSAHLMVYNAQTTRFVYCSASVEVNMEIFLDAPMVRKQWIDDNFIFPVGIILENPDTATFGVHVNDYSSVALRLRGLRKLMSKVITLDREDNPKRGPPPGTLQNYVFEVEQNRTGILFQTGTKHGD